MLYKRDKTKEDIEQLIEEHQKLVYYMLGKTKQIGNHAAESAAWEALWTAVCTFDVYSKTKFSTYACTLIKNAIYDVLRKQYKQYKMEQQYIEAGAQDIIIDENTEWLDKVFADYVKSKKGNARNILLVWRSSDFTASVTNIAIICKCSKSNVTRTQQSFRAYLAGLL